MEIDGPSADLKTSSGTIGRKRWPLGSRVHQHPVSRLQNTSIPVETGACRGLFLDGKGHAAICPIRLEPLRFQDAVWLPLPSDEVQGGVIGGVVDFDSLLSFWATALTFVSPFTNAELPTEAVFQTIEEGERRGFARAEGLRYKYVCRATLKKDVDEARNFIAGLERECDSSLCDVFDFIENAPAQLVCSAFTLPNAQAILRTQLQEFEHNLGNLARLSMNAAVAMCQVAQGRVREPRFELMCSRTVLQSHLRDHTDAFFETKLESLLYSLDAPFVGHGGLIIDTGSNDDSNTDTDEDSDPESDEEEEVRYTGHAAASSTGAPVSGGNGNGNSNRGPTANGNSAARVATVPPPLAPFVATIFLWSEIAAPLPGASPPAADGTGFQAVWMANAAVLPPDRPAPSIHPPPPPPAL